MTEQKKRTGENFHVKEGRASEHTYSLCNRHGPMVVRRHLPARANLSRKFAFASCFEHPKRTPNDFVRNYITPVRSSISLAVYGACSGHSHRTCFCFEKCDIGNGGKTQDAFILELNFFCLIVKHDHLAHVYKETQWKCSGVEYKNILC